MIPKVYIDGKEGTTGLQIYDRLSARSDLELLLIDEDKRKDAAQRKKLMDAADIVFLCLPDAAAREAVSLVEDATPGSSTVPPPIGPPPAGPTASRSCIRASGRPSPPRPGWRTPAAMPQASSPSQPRWWRWGCWTGTPPSPASHSPAIPAAVSR